MENNEHELIRRFIKVNAELRRLYQEHSKLERSLSRYQNRTFLTAHEEMELKRLKMKKLMGVERMMGILADYRTNGNLSAEASLPHESSLSAV